MGVALEYVSYAAYALALAALASAFTRVEGPYMDEPFHLRQTQAYCAGRWDEWDEKITTFPGLYFCGAAGAWLRAAMGSTSVESACNLSTLRSLNLLPALATPPLLAALLADMHPSLPPSERAANVAVLSLLPMHFFFHFLYYTDSAATCSVLLLLLLLRRRPTTLARRLAAAAVAALSLSIRQTNAVWIAFGVASSAIAELRDSGALREHRQPVRAVRELLRALPGALPALAAMHALPLMLLAGFAAFVVHNGGVVVGDRANHAPVAHGAQLLYLTAAASAPFAIGELTLGLPSTLAAAGRAAAAAPLAAAASAAAVVVAAHLTYSHPFLLADNRHVTFYLWRHILGRRGVRYVLAPAHLLLARLLYPPIWQRHGALITLGLVGCAALVLVPTPLLEPRYLTLPALLLRLHAPPLIGARRWLPPLLGFAAINAVAIGLFLLRPYTWVDGSVARLMW